MENRYAVVDIGSNTVRMVIYDQEENGALTRVIGEKASLGLVNFVSDGCMSDLGLNKLLETLEGFGLAAAKVGCDELVAFATASLRGLENTNDILEKIKAHTGIIVDVLSGEEEAAFNFGGLQAAFALTDGMMVDMGGGSTEVLSFAGGDIAHLSSLPFGCLQLHKQFISEILPTTGEEQAIRAYVRRHVASCHWLPGAAHTAYAMGGTAKAATKVYGAFYGEGRPKSLHIGQLTGLYRQLTANKEQAAILLVEEVPDRLHTLLPGLCGLIELLHIAGAERVVISECGVREGYLARHLSRETTRVAGD